MKLHSLVYLISILIILINCHQQFDNYLDPWNSLATIQGQFDKNHTLFKQSKCDPCDYLIIVFRENVQLLIDNPKQGKQDSVIAFSFVVSKQHFQQKIWDFDQHKFSLQSNKNIQQVIQRTSKKGLQWSYQLTLPIEGLILKGHTQFYYENLIPLVTFIFSIFIFITFPFSGQGRKQQLIQIPRRTPLVSLLILAHLQHILLIQLTILLIKYIIYEESFLAKSLWYVLFMIPFGFLTLQIVYLYDAIRVRYLKMFQKAQSARIKDIGLVMTFFIGIYGAGILLLLAGKGIWVFGYFSIYLCWQIVESLFTKTYPYLTISGYYFVLVGYQMFLSNYEPLFWFEQLTRLQIVVYWVILLVIFILGSLIQRVYIGIQMVNQVLFEQSKNIQMGDQGSAKSTQVNLET